YRAYRILRRDPAGHRLIVELTVVLRTTVEDALERAGALGLVPGCVEVAGDAEYLLPSPNLLPAAARPRSTQLVRRTIVGLAAVAMTLAAATVALPLYRNH